MRTMLLALALAPGLWAQAPDAFAPLRFLEGTWSGEGAGSGRATFRFELQGRALVRTNVTDLPAANGRPAQHHEDLMTIFQEGGQLKALYVDNEGHVIRYGVVGTPEGAVFTSEPAPGTRFRLSYLKQPDATVVVRFELAPPAKPEAFSVYLEGRTRKAP